MSWFRQENKFVEMLSLSGSQENLYTCLWQRIPPSSIALLQPFAKFENTVKLLLLPSKLIYF